MDEETKEHLERLTIHLAEAVRLIIITQEEVENTKKALYDLQDDFEEHLIYGDVCPHNEKP